MIAGMSLNDAAHGGKLKQLLVFAIRFYESAS
jgi:hypothetical protein